MTENEIILPVKGYEEFYSASNFGRVFSNNYRKTGKFKELAQSILVDKRRDSETYYKRCKAYYINKNTPTAVHRIIAMTFVSNPNGFNQVNHIDGNKGNNNSSNLEWVTNSVNQKHAYLSGLHTPKAGELHAMSVLTLEQVIDIRNALEIDNFRGKSKELAKKYGVSISCISNIYTRKTWGHV